MRVETRRVGCSWREHGIQRTVVIPSGRPFPCLLVETHVLTFRITTPFDEWAKTYDGSADLQKAAGITSLYRGVSKDDPSRCCAVMQAEAGVMERFIADNAELIASSGHVLESTTALVFLDHA